MQILKLDGTLCLGLPRLKNLRGANLHGVNLHGADLYGADLYGADLSITCLVDGGQRSDGWRFVGWAKDGILQIRAGCRNFAIDEARAHWQSTRGGTPLGDETFAILDHIVAVAKIRGLTKMTPRQSNKPAPTGAASTRRVSTSASARRDGATDMTPDEFKTRMQAIYREQDEFGVFVDVDTERTHCAADDLLCEALESLGYGEGVAIFEAARKWYA